VRRQLQSELTTLTRAAANRVCRAGEGGASQPLADQVRRLESELEALQVKRESWEKDWESMRAKRTKNRHEHTLAQLKRSIRSRALPAIIVAEPVR
jgi:hypothetical protein